MKNDIIQVWAVHQGDTDMSNGAPAHFFSKESDAKIAASGNGWYGGNAPISKRYLIRLNEKYYLLDSPQPIDLDGTNAKNKEIVKAKVLAKLTSEEKDALGIKEK